MSTEELTEPSINRGVLGLNSLLGISISLYWSNRLNKDTVFTVEYDEKYKNKPSLVCLKEDTTDPKWLFWVGDLIEVKE